MNFLIILKVALRTLRRTLLRSGLTALGIIIGVAAVIAMVSIGNGAKAQVEETLAGVDSNRLMITADTPHDPHGGRAIPLTPADRLNLEDYRALRSGIPGISLASVELFVGVPEVRASGRRSDADLRGIDIEGFDVAGRRIAAGSSFGEADVRRAASVAVISRHVARNLFAGEDALGRLIRIRDIPFTVIGVMADDERLRDVRRAESGDVSVYVPYTSVLRRLDRNRPITIVLKAERPEELGRIQQQVSDLLERRRGSRRAVFNTGNFEEVMRQYLEGSRTMTLLLGAIGGISLLVGGIGIMNIMLVSVTERTREIGIRLAIGTRSRDLLRQFLIEAVILSVLGGAIGIAVGVGAARLITHLNEWPTSITLGSVIGAFLCSAAIGVFFGYYPARQAANLDPIEALRAE